MKNLAVDRRRVSTPSVRARVDPYSNSRTDPPAKPVRRIRASTRRPARSLTPDLSSRLRTSQRALRTRLEGRAALIDMMRAVNGTLDPARIADVLLERAAAWMPVPFWAVVSADLSDHLAVVAERALPSELKVAVHGIARWVMARGVELATADLGRDVRVSAAANVAAIAFPLSSRGRTIGVLIGVDRAPSARTPTLSPPLLRALKLHFEPASAALDTAVRLARAEGLSVTDDLTGLYNSRFLNQVLRRETKRASRAGRPLSLLFLDLDEFKTVNDRHGHLAGSRALVEAADVIRGSARETDVVARFGGDEFALVLPDTGGPGAFAVGERIRDRIAAHPFLASQGLNVRLTVSVGVATLPDAAIGADELVQAADAAMYRIKDRGKNGIEAAAAPADR